jgi:hypothetical protein
LVNNVWQYISELLLRVIAMNPVKCTLEQFFEAGKIGAPK